MELEDAAGRILQSGCEGQIFALLQSPDPELSALAAFICSRMAANATSHDAFLSWSAPLRLSKAVQLSGNSTTRLDAMTCIRLLSKNPRCLPSLRSSAVLPIIVDAAEDLKDGRTCAKALGTIASLLEIGGESIRTQLEGLSAPRVISRALSSPDRNVARAAAAAQAALLGHATIRIPLGEDGGLSKERSVATPALWTSASQAHRGEEGGGSAGRSAFDKFAEEMSSSLTGGGGEDLVTDSNIEMMRRMMAQDDLELRRRASSLLLSLCKAGERCRFQLVDKDGISLLSRAITSKDPKMQLNALTSLACLSNVSALHQALVDHDVPTSILHFLSSEDEGLKVQAMKTLSHLAAHKRAKEKILQDKHVLSLLQSAKTASPHDAFFLYLSILKRHVEAGKER
mmetsp:Transcript_39500/g.124283  ORF Transcript_39500/g.124283 Transcript_39500/m.124283 type:complete len:400 (-) Transcript_39500:48-1247(-)